MKTKRGLAFLMALAMLMGVSGCKKKKKAQTYEYTCTDKNHRGISEVSVKLYPEDSDVDFYISAFENTNSDKVAGVVGCAVNVYWIPKGYVFGPEEYMEKNPLPEVKEVTIEIKYEEEYLRGVPEENLLLLYARDDSFECIEVPGAEHDLKKNCFTADITDLQCNLLLVDAYEYYKSQGKDASKYKYELPDKFKYMSTWEKELYTGSIMEIADLKWMNAHTGATFHVSTPEQLAAVVYYVNTKDSLGTQLYLDADIDLTGYEWMPMGWISERSDEVHEFVGLIDGQGHTIKGLHLDGGHGDCGFVGYSTNLTMKDITFTDAEVTGTWNLGICAGEVIGKGKWENVHAEGNLSGSKRAGGLVGWVTDLNFENCSASITIDGGSEVFSFLTYPEKKAAELGIQEIFTLTLEANKDIKCNIVPGYSTMHFHIERNGETVLECGPDEADPETMEMTLEHRHYAFRGKGEYKVYVEAYVDDIYLRVSNIIEVTI